MSAPAPLRAVQGDATLLRSVFGCFPSGVTAVCAEVDGVAVGMAASSFTSVSMTPPLVSVCVQNSSRTWPVLRRADRIGVSVLSEEHETACRSLSAKSGDRFAGIDWFSVENAAVFLSGASALLDCTVHDEVPAGDHTIILLEIHQLLADHDTVPLVFHGSRFRRLMQA
ncbi:flavin reductase family protein [Pseudonocardia sp.]|jgi:flavin reductase (DIM6/NTAB) family NADH-FMN oxidoreductase RutF|uniref:flavin reductase family protein n=1 Tax=Pseudonocardia sp. TaxID=60912 RepID=UPI003D152AA1